MDREGTKMPFLSYLSLWVAVSFYMVIFTSV